ncbi:MAG: aminotransferase class V-fold PLP-dependent enzyme [Ruminococcus sp.]|nr:aminotransferase class V-fold PLP-dependent enzyme [Ruminococcus sp.]
MIYFDNGATTYPKPPAVVRAVCSAVTRLGANPGRSGHRMSLRAAETLFSCRQEVAALFGLQEPERVVFTQNCTAALNTVIHGVLKQGDHVVISSLEHNAVVRPLEAMKRRGVDYSVAEVVEGDDEQTIRHFREKFRANTRLVICTHASNVFGIRLPVERIAALCHLNGILFCLDAAQSAGVVPIDLRNSGMDFLCTAGHKGLYGPMGTGVLIINSATTPDSLIQGGTGSFSAEKAQPEVLPDKYESGTPNVAGIAGLREGVRFVRQRGAAGIEQYEMQLARRLYNRLSRIERVLLYTQPPSLGTHVPVVSFNIEGMDSEEVARLLDERFGIAVRAGLHCAPLAHQTMGTNTLGTVRAVVSVFNNAAQVDQLTGAVNKIVKLNEKKVAIDSGSVLK